MTPSQAAQEKPTSPRALDELWTAIMWTFAGHDALGSNSRLRDLYLEARREAAGKDSPATPSLDRNLLAEAIFESGVRQTMSQSEQAADNILAEIPIILARLDEGSATPDQGKGEPR